MASVSLVVQMCPVLNVYSKSELGLLPVKTGTVVKKDKST